MELIVWFISFLIMKTKMKSLETKNSEEGGWQVWGLISEQKPNSGWNSYMVH